MSQPTPYSDFIQQMPQLNNEFADDIFLQDYLHAFFPAESLPSIIPDLTSFGRRTATEFLEWAKEAENHPPQLIQFDAWGKRIDTIRVSQGWMNLERVAAEDGLVAIGYERKFGEHSRLYQFVKLYLYTASSAIYTCPLAMTDGAARLIEVYGDDFLKKSVFKGLTSRDPSAFKTSGQWMTERTGGSDVSRSMTIARPDGDHYLLYGHKWFTSAITANMAFTLASTEQPDKDKRAPLSLFYLPIRNDDGSLNGIQVEALKNKLGTRALPTAQLLLNGAKAKLVGEKGRGVKTIATLFNITRIYNTISAVSYLRRAFALSYAYSTIREAFGKPLGQHSLHRKILREMEIAYQSNALLAFFLSRCLGKEECGTAKENHKALLRFLTPVAKLYTAKQAIRYASEHIETFGGLGYLEDSGIPVMLRDTQVLSIWEGTTNVLSLDMLRAAQKENGIEAFKNFAIEMLKNISPPALAKQKLIVENKLQSLFDFLSSLPSQEAFVRASRDIAFYIAELTIALLWLEFLQHHLNTSSYITALNYWITFKMNENSLRAAEYLEI